MGPENAAVFPTGNAIYLWAEGAAPQNHSMPQISVEPSLRLPLGNTTLEIKAGMFTVGWRLTFQENSSSCAPANNEALKGCVHRPPQCFSARGPKPWLAHRWARFLSGEKKEEGKSRCWESRGESWCRDVNVKQARGVRPSKPPPPAAPLPLLAHVTPSVPVAKPLTSKNRRHAKGMASAPYFPTNSLGWHCPRLVKHVYYSADICFEILCLHFFF